MIPKLIWICFLKSGYLNKNSDYWSSAMLFETILRTFIGFCLSDLLVTNKICVIYLRHPTNYKILSWLTNPNQFINNGTRIHYGTYLQFT